MFKISNFQLYCIMVLFTAPLAFLQTSKLAIEILANNAWLAVLGSVVPGILLIFMFDYIIKKSQNPFPFMLEEHLGKIGGKIVGFIYILVFLLITSFSLRLFVDFIETNVLPQTPISVFLGVLLVLGYVSIKTGFLYFARVCELIVFIGLSFAFIIVSLAFFQDIDIKNILPLGFMSFKDFSKGLFAASSDLFKIMPVLTLAFFTGKKTEAARIMLKVLLTYITLITLTTFVTILTFGGVTARFLSFPTFSVVRLINIADFISNVDVIFVGLWIIGVFAAVTIPWFMFCFTTLYVFNLRDYRFLAAPTTLIIGIIAIQMASNILELSFIVSQVVPVILALFFGIIPFIIFIITLFKPYPDKSLPEDYPAKMSL